jgi:hypothetical protein
MIGMLFLYILGYLILLGLPVGALLYVTRPQLAVWWERRRLRLKGERNALLLKAYEAQLCRFCYEPCTEADCYEPGRGWFHIKCLQALLGQGE